MTSEVGTGGDMGRSIAAVTPGGDGRATFEKQAPTVAYGAYADDLLTTLRRTPDAEPGDQVVVLTQREPGRRSSRPARGTRSACAARARPATSSAPSSPPEQVLADAVLDASRPSRWCRSRTSSGRTSGSASPPTRSTAPAPSCAPRPSSDPDAAAADRAAPLAPHERAVAAARRGRTRRCASSSTPRGPGRERLSTMATILRFNNLKIAASEQAPRVCQGAMAVCGIVGYKNDTPFSIGRHLRDTMSASLMVANERIHQTNAGLLLIAKDV